MIYRRPRKPKKSAKGFYICYESYGFMTNHYVENHHKVEAFLDNLEENGMTPEQLAKVRVYPALSWQVRNALLDQDGDLRFWVWTVIWIVSFIAGSHFI